MAGRAGELTYQADNKSNASNARERETEGQRGASRRAEGDGEGEVERPKQQQEAGGGGEAEDKPRKRRAAEAACAVRFAASFFPDSRRPFPFGPRGAGQARSREPARERRRTESARGEPEESQSDDGWDGWDGEASQGHGHGRPAVSTLLCSGPKSKAGTTQVEFQRKMPPRKKAPSVRSTE
ncbi:uncharacterized protein ARB_07184 [Trichophyton benhamiae CBS 112371]|uniref:Uncharacterized protein n=1 Tax=Arthroderma benhamiae (strain ATCC MYA-4681 / CBS 112371) TaxID=663331 RepID=D4ASG9_ARTBC|nr:uncharacterized protein ARB_07184 [Trichophyton benhamiae CBS 112371]EFE34233.1 hypothetical protein ARB_07184 [Trichophyton benhamiae CBS 112371]